MRDAARWGVIEEFIDYRGNPRSAARAAIEAVLDAMEADGVAPPDPLAWIIEVGESVDTFGVTELRTEDGGSAPVGDGLPPDLPAGYHSLVHADGFVRPLIVSPGRCFLPEDLRTWGWAAQLYNVRSADSWGAGDLADLRRLGTWSASQGAEALLLNPLHAPAPAPVQQPSPYFPSSRCFRNPLYLRIEDVPGAGALGPRLGELARAGRALNTSSTIDRDEIYRLKRAALEELWSAWDGSDAFDAFRSEQGSSLRDFATFMALYEEFQGWPGVWPDGYEHPGASSVVAWRQQNIERVMFHTWVQWLIDEQLREASRSTGLIHDLSIGVDAGGADAWMWQNVFARTATMGAPPDEFNAQGQNWGLPPFDPWKLRAAAYEPFIATVRSGLRHGTGLRIDHVMWMFRVYWIPEKSDPHEGVYVRYPFRDLLNILALESQRASAYVVGEDLGTVEGFVREEMSERDMLSYKVMWFEGDPPHRYPAQALAAVTNHDLPTIAGLWSGDDLQEQHVLGLDPDEDSAAAMKTSLRWRLGVDHTAPDENVIENAYKLLAQAPSALLFATLEDAARVKRRPNLPGTTDERPNWSVPLPMTLEELERDGLAQKIGSALNERKVDPDLRVDRQTKLHHRYADLPGLRMHYVEAGDGPLVIMLHGFPDFWYSWRHQIPAFARAGYRVVAPDMRGYNLTDKPEGVAEYSIEHLTDDIAALIEHLGSDRAHVVGHDWGGLVAWFLAMRHPARVDRLSILNFPHPAAAGRGGLNPRQWLKSWYILFFQLPLVPELATSLFDYAALRSFYRNDATPGAFTDGDIARYLDAAERSDRLRYPINYYRAAMRRNPLGLRAQVKVIDRPVLVIWGDRDSHIEPGLAEPPSRWVPDVRVHRFPHATHWVHMDEPGPVNRLLAQFLGGDLE